MPSQTIEFFGLFGTVTPERFHAECKTCGDPAIGGLTTEDDGKSAIFTYYCKEHKPNGGFTSMIHSMWPKMRVTSRIERGVYRVVRLSRKEQENRLREKR